VFDLSEGLLDWIEIGRVWRQEPEPCAGGSDQVPDFGRFAKRLENGAFRWPSMQDGVIRLSAAQFSALLEGLDWRRAHAIDTLAPIVAS
jgi:transposase